MLFIIKTIQVVVEELCWLAIIVFLVDVYLLLKTLKSLIVVELLTKQPIIICLIYNPPKSTHQNLLSFLSEFMQSEGHKADMGD